MRIPNERGNLGKYDEVSERVLKEVKASAVIVLVIGGNKGSGCSVSITNLAELSLIPDLLDAMARDIREQVNKEAKN